MEMKWYAVHTQVGFEKKVKESIEKKVELLGLKDKVEKVLIPIEEVIEIKKKGKKVKERRLYPSYVFIKTHLDNEVFNVIKKLAYVTGFVGSRKEPIPLSDEDISLIFEKLEKAKEAPRPAVSFEQGDKVRIADGPFTDFIGTVEEVNLDKARLKIKVSIFGRSTPVELDYNQVDKIEE
ncbi:MAG: transcription termination/antitermination factor NusG [Deltaproteobacteria bacterium]|nr:transcription termination/antitermination factor NusG [Deltaproteobacteria bacterium]